jgi:hypothetical protein
MVNGILADVNAEGHIAYLVALMQAEPWTDFWLGLRLNLRRFDDVGLPADSGDREIWQRCQSEGLILITDNRNDEGAESLEATIRELNSPDALPVFTIADLDRFRADREYAERIVERLYSYLLEIDSVRGTGRLFLP